MGHGENGEQKQSETVISGEEINLLSLKAASWEAGSLSQTI